MYNYLYWAAMKCLAAGEHNPSNRYYVKTTFYSLNEEIKRATVRDTTTSISTSKSVFIVLIPISIRWLLVKSPIAGDRMRSTLKLTFSSVKGAIKRAIVCDRATVLKTTCNVRQQDTQT